MADLAAGRSSSKSAPTTTTSEFRLTAKQRTANRLLGGPQRHTLLVGGSRSGKTMLFCRAILLRALKSARSRHTVLRLRANAARSSIWLDTLPKTARLCFPGLTLKDHRQDGFVSLPNGSQIWIGGLDDKDRVDKILGQEFTTLYLNECSEIPYASAATALTRLAQVAPGLRQRAYYDLNPVGKSHWSYRLFVQGIDPESRRPLAAPADYRYAFLSPLDNAANLTPEYIDSLRTLPERKRRRFFDGVYVEEVEGALWTLELLARARCAPEDAPATLRRVVVAVDPSGTAGNPETRSDDVGIVVAGLADDGRAYILDDLTCNLPPEAWGRRVVAAYHKHKADSVIAEGNFGGDMVRFVIHAADRNVPVKLVSASRGKAIRAEPVSALYGHEQDGNWLDDRVRHAGEFGELEDELLNFSSAGYIGPKSPNRADSAIWAITELMLAEQPSFGAFEYMRRQADAAKPPPPAPRPSTYARGSQEWRAGEDRNGGGEP
jgi:phage terminase large subunit-like protein